MVDTPPDSATKESRQHPRLGVSLWAVESTEEAAYFHYVTEISKGGLFLEKKLPLEVGSAVALEIKLPTGPTIKATGTVIRQDAGGKGNAIKFNELSDEDVNNLETFLRLQSESKQSK